MVCGIHYLDCMRRKKVRHSLTEVMTGWGFRLMETPTLEFYDTVGVQSAITDTQLLSFLIKTGKL